MDQRSGIGLALALLAAGVTEPAWAAAKGEARGSDGAFMVVGPNPLADVYRDLRARVFLRAWDKTGEREALSGDRATLSAELRLGADRYVVQLNQAGVPDQGQAVSRRPRRSLLGASGVAPARHPTDEPPPSPLPDFAIEGGVALGEDVGGNAELGWPALPRAHAAIAVWGLAKVWKNKRLIADRAPLFVVARTQGLHEDVPSHRLRTVDGQIVGQEGDYELELMVRELPSNEVPGGVLDLVWEKPRIKLDGRELKPAP